MLKHLIYIIKNMDICYSPNQSILGNIVKWYRRIIGRDYALHVEYAFLLQKFFDNHLLHK